LLAQTKISNFKVAIRVKEHILRFEISVDDAISMEAPNGFNELCGVEASTSLWELGLLPEMEEEFTSVEEVHDEVEFGICLEGIMELDNKGTVNLLEDVSLSYKQKHCGS
jgi:hypothetical protein